MARPTKSEAIAIKKRDVEMKKMADKGYPLEYIASYYSLSKSRIIRIVKGREENNDGQQNQNEVAGDQKKDE